MAKIENESLSNHEYDGIRELDNFLPSWWNWLFIITIVFSIGYILHYHILKTGDSQYVEYYKEVNPEWSKSDLKMAGPAYKYESPYKSDGGKEALAVSGKTEQSQPNEGEPILISLLTDQDSMEKGKSIYDKNCLVCHGANGEGLIGPNFCDTNWIHGGAIEDLVKIINVGVPEKGMIPWDKILTPKEILQVSSFILTFEGTNPPNQKAPEGKEYKRG